MIEIEMLFIAMSFLFFTGAFVGFTAGLLLGTHLDAWEKERKP